MTSSNQDRKNNVATLVAKLKLKLKFNTLTLCLHSLSDNTQGESVLILCISVAHVSESCLDGVTKHIADVKYSLL